MVLLDYLLSYRVLFALAMKDTTVCFKIERALKDKLAALAKKENRSLSNFIELILKDEMAKRESQRSRLKPR